MINLTEKDKSYIGKLFHIKIKAWKVLLIGVITLIPEAYIFLKTEYGSDINTITLFFLVASVYAIISTILKLYNFRKYGIEH